MRDRLAKTGSLPQGREPFSLHTEERHKKAGLGRSLGR